MGTSDATYARCTCSKCLRQDSNGVWQQQGTIRLHLKKNGREISLLASTSKLQPLSHSNASTASFTPLDEPETSLDISDNEAVSPGRGGSLDGSADFNPEADDYLWPASDHDSDTETHFHFSSDSESDNVDDSITEPRDTSDEEPDTDDSSDSESEVEEITSDPLFLSRGSLFDAFQQGEKSPSDDETVPWAFDDHPAILNAYIRAFVGAAFEGMTKSAVANMLSSSRILLSSGESMGANFPGLANFATTLPTVEKRLGVSTDDLIVYLFLCSECWKAYFPNELPRLNSPHCDNPACSGMLYTTKRLASGAEKRTPLLTLPFVPPERALQRLCLQPGKVSQWQEWRGPADSPGRREPSKLEGYDAFDDLDKPMTDISDGWGWRAIQAGLERRRNGVWEIRDVDVAERAQQFVALPNGLVFQINIDWFQAVKRGCHSTGAMYATVCNNPRGIRNLREETMLLLMFPGPREPNSEQYNNAMEIPVRHFKRLYNGVPLNVHGKPAKEPFHVQIGTDVSDLPASRKTSGLLACTSKYFMCDHCDTPFYALVDPDAFNSTVLNQRDPWRYLKYAFRARDASAEVAEEISRRRGIRFSAMHNIVNWLPGVTGLFDPMHALFGCLIKHLCKNILYNNGLIDPDTMEEFFQKIIWPPSVSRLPPWVTRGAGSIKADQWRSLIAILFVALFDAWQVDGEIPDVEAEPPAANTKIAAAQASQEKLVRARMRENLLAKHPETSEEELDFVSTVTMDRSLRKHYDTIVQFTAALRITTSNTISPNEVKRGCHALESSVQSWARMNCHLVPYFHFAAVHLEEQLLRYGPIPGWWTYPYERNNGFLGRFNINGHSGGEMEGTMMRGWWKTTLIQDLISRLECIPDPAKEDLDSLSVLRSYLKGGTSERRGTLQNYIAKVQTANNPYAIEFSKFSQSQSLRELGPGYYKLVFDFLKLQWRSDITLVADIDLTKGNNELSFSGRVRSFSHVWIKKQRFGAATQHRGKSAQYAYIDNRVPVNIMYILQAEETLWDESKVSSQFAIVRRFQENTVIQDFPWDLWATDIGVRAWQANVLASLEIVALERLTGHFILIPLTVRTQSLWITIAYDHDATETDVSYGDDEYGE
ncbi:hypothetical protein R3P38DRAFT_3350014 [Favolaschia claudopus]|uniref:Uncharacterized protein n=1 Tax=Favolaschia claudopus TaxID=2862362 RepID=A0AAW0CND3_9AGAR